MRPNPPRVCPYASPCYVVRMPRSVSRHNPPIPPLFPRTTPGRKVVATTALKPGSVVMRERGLAVLADTVASGAGFCPVCFGQHAPDANGGRCFDIQVRLVFVWCSHVVYFGGFVDVGGSISSRDRSFAPLYTHAKTCTFTRAATRTPAIRPLTSGEVSHVARCTIFFLLVRSAG